MLYGLCNILFEFDTQPGFDSVAKPPRRRLVECQQELRGEAAIWKWLNVMAKRARCSALIIARPYEEARSDNFGGPRAQNDALI